jgi:hypothetical protein
MLKKIYVLTLMAAISTVAYAEDIAEISTAQNAHDYLIESKYEIKGVAGNIEAFVRKFESSGCQTSYEFFFEDKNRSGDMGQYLKEIDIDWNMVNSVSQHPRKPNIIFVNPARSTQYTRLNGWQKDSARRESGAVLSYRGNDIEAILQSLQLLKKSCN